MKRFVWLLSLAFGVSAIFACALLAGRAPGSSANVLNFTGSMEGDMDIHPGDWAAAGYFLRIDGNHPATTIFVDNASVTIHVTCPPGTLTGDIVIPLDPGPVTIPANSPTRQPSADQDAAASFQG